MIKYVHVEALCTTCVYGEAKSRSIAMATIERFVAMGLLSSKTNITEEKDIKTLVLSVCEAASREEIGVQAIKTINTLALSNVLMLRGTMIIRLLKSCVELAARVKQELAKVSSEQIVCVILQRAQRDKNNIPDVMLMIESLSNLVKKNSAGLSLRLLHVALSEISNEIVKRKDSSFRKLVQHNVCTCLLKHAVSKNIETLNHALGLFILLVRRYRRFLRSQIEILIREIFFGILKSSNSSSEVKMKVVKMLATLARGKDGGQFFVELFLTYDCETEDASTTGLVESMVKILAQIVRSSSCSSLKQSALSGMVDIMCSISKFAENSSFSSLKENVSNVEKKSPSDDDEEEEDEEDDDEEEEEGVEEEELTLDNAETLIKNRRAKQRHLKTTFKLYNTKAKKGIAYLTSRNMLENTPETVANFIYKHRDDLNKSQTGEYLGSDHEFNLSVMHNFVDLNEFKTLEVDRAIRVLLSGFRLPGESQKIDRIMEKFAERYVSCNPESIERFKSADNIFALAFGIIMLQTDLHSDQIRPDRKMTIEKFVSLTSEFVSNDEKYLRGIYKRIKDEPITLVDDELERLKRDDGKKRFRNFFRSKIERRDSQFGKETELMVREAAEQLRVSADVGSILHVERCTFQQLRSLMSVIWRSVRCVCVCVMDLPLSTLLNTHYTIARTQNSHISHINSKQQ